MIYSWEEVVSDIEVKALLLHSSPIFLWYLAFIPESILLKFELHLVSTIFCTHFHFQEPLGRVSQSFLLLVALKHDSWQRFVKDHDHNLLFWFWNLVLEEKWSDLRWTDPLENNQALFFIFLLLRGWEFFQGVKIGLVWLICSYRRETDFCQCRQTLCYFLYFMHSSSFLASMVGVFHFFLVLLVFFVLKNMRIDPFMMIKLIILNMTITFFKHNMLLIIFKSLFFFFVTIFDNLLSLLHLFFRVRFIFFIRYCSLGQIDRSCSITCYFCESLVIVDRMSLKF